MISFTLFVFVLKYLTCCAEANITPTDDANDRFNFFFQQFAMNEINMVHEKSDEILAQLKAEQGSDSSISDANLIFEVKRYVEFKLQEFQPIAHEIFLNAAFNRRHEYYVLDAERRIWHKPYQDFEKIQFDGVKRNKKLLEYKMASAWHSLHSSHSSLQARRFGIVQVMKPIKNPFNSIFKPSGNPGNIAKSTNPGNIAKSTNLGKINIQSLGRIVSKYLLQIGAGISGGLIGLLVISLSKIWGDYNLERDKRSFGYRLGKKGLTDDVNVYCKE